MATDPICGMYVDDRTATLQLVRDNRTYYFCATSCRDQFAAPERELDRLRLRLALAWPASIAVVFLTYGLAPGPGSWVSLGLAGAVEFYAGLGFFRGTWDAVRSRMWNMDVLIAVGTLTAFAYSVAVLVFPGRLPPALYFDASALIVTLILTGNYLEHLTRHRASQALRRLQELLPTTVLRVSGDTVAVVPIAEVRAGDLLRVRPGDRVPVDAVVRRGSTSSDESLVTGESLPVDKRPGSRVIAGSVNLEGVIDIEAEQVGEDTLLAAIGRLVVEAESSQVPLQKLADRIAQRFVPAVLALAVAAAIAWFLLGAGFTIALLVFVSVAITACPCAFGLATPAALMVGTGRAAEEGVLFKGRDAIERTARVDTIVTDKTGTLTRGRPAVSDVIPAEGTSTTELLGVAAALESDSTHPLARAVLDAATTAHIPPVPIDHVSAEVGTGIRGMSLGEPVSIRRGDPAGLDTQLSGPLRAAADRVESEGKTWSIVRRGELGIGILAFSDPPSAGAQAAVAALQSEGIEVVMATGDHRAAAEDVARRVGIRTVHAGLTPAAKLDLLHDLQRAGRRVGFVGDGINDAPALLAADVGIAIGAGTDVAKESGQVILVRSDFATVPLALTAGRRTVRKVRQNLFWALGYNSVLLPVAAGALVPLFGLGIFTVLPIVGALAMGLSSTSVLLNSLSLRRQIRPVGVAVAKP